MRKVTQKAIGALMNKQNIKISNTEVISNGRKCGLYLFGNLIAERDIVDNTIEITNAGWFSNTTRERLNAIPGVSITQRNGKWFLNGKEWDGKPIIINL